MSEQIGASSELSSQQVRELHRLKERYSNSFHEFDLKEQIKVCASLLEYFRDTVLKRDECGLSKGGRVIKNRREKKAIIKSLIRVSSESVDHRSTVDFISVGALQMRLDSNGREDDISHEHMVPGEVIFNAVFDSKGRPIANLLEQWSFRALITKSERLKLDRTREIKSGIPRNIPVGFGVEFYPFARYEAVGIFDGNLLPISERGERLLSSYLDARRILLPGGVWEC